MTATRERDVALAEVADHPQTSRLRRSREVDALPGPYKGIDSGVPTHVNSVARYRNYGRGRQNTR